jgi:hypothetical protein
LYLGVIEASFLRLMCAVTETDYRLTGLVYRKTGGYIPVSFRWRWQQCQIEHVVFHTGTCLTGIAC